MATISLCMIVKNEKNVLSRCLDSIKNAVDEIIIVDTGSTDTTKEIAENIQIRFLILNGLTIFQWHEIFPFQRQPRIILCGLMLMM